MRAEQVGGSSELVAEGPQRWTGGERRRAGGRGGRGLGWRKGGDRSGGMGW
jgi:hypothetical protein